MITPRLVLVLTWISLLTLSLGAPFDDRALQGDLTEPLPYEVSRVFSDHSFREPVDFIPEPGSDRIVVIQLTGEVLRFDPLAEPPALETLAELKGSIKELLHLYGMAFHPRYEENGLVYLCYTLEGHHHPDGTQLVECQTDRETGAIDLASRRLILTWFQGGHNGGSLHFGPEGYLYVSSGDAEGPNPPDSLRAGQDCSNLLSSIMRIDIDRRDPGLAYRIPPDNPFNDLAGARPEIWAFGFRNPWRMSFDKKTGDLWVGDVGWDTWELVYLVRRGANYGWSVMEGRQPINVSWDRGPVPISPPIAEHAHIEARSITGGYVYYGNRFPELRGAYIYGDYETGKLWALWQDRGVRTRLAEIADCELRISCFGQTWDGEVYIVDYAGGIYQLDKRPENVVSASAAVSFPDQLSKTGLFTDISKQQPANGLIPYQINTSRWADGLEAQRWLALPQGGKVTLDRPSYPEGTLFVKTLSVPDTKHPIETQILQRRQGAWRAFSYAWKEDGTDADLVPAQGRRRTIAMGAGDNRRSQPWHAAGQSECLVCHNAQAGSVLGFNVWQLDEDARSALDDAEMIQSRRRRGSPETAAVPAARTYLDVNCACCHRLNGGGLVPMNLVRDLPNDKLEALGVEPQRGTFSILNAKVISPGQPERSTVYYRMAKLGSGRMPHLGSHVVDDDGLALIYAWIESLDDQVNRTLTEEDAVPRTLVRLHELGEAGVEETSLPTVADLYRRYEIDGTTTDPAEEDAPGDPSVVLSLIGDATRGAELMQGPRGAICLTCHQIGSQGSVFGPSLNGIGARRTTSHLLESLLLPSKEIDHAYVNYSLSTADGSTLTGFIRHHHRSGIRIQQADLLETTVPIGEIATLVASDLSVMPAGLAKAFTDAELADLLAYLVSLR